MWRDLLLSAAAGVVATVLAAWVEFHENLFELTRRWESMQLDELPVGIFVFALCLTGFYARRQVELRRVLDDNRRLAQRTLDVQEAERKHLARELHDELGQYLNAIQLDCQAITGAEGAEPPHAIARRIGANAGHVYGVVGRMINRLRPAGLDELGLAAALESCIAGWRASQPAMQFGLALSGDLDDLGERLNLAIYRIVQESLTNSVRHSGAAAVQVALQREAGSSDGRVLLTVRDDGRGMAGDRRRTPGRGLAGMRERVAMLGGHFEVLSPPGGGVTIRAMFTLPVTGT